MESIGNIISKGLATPVPQTKALSPRQQVLKDFVTVINGARVSDGYKPYPESYICVRMYKAGYKTVSHLKMLFGSCSDAINFSATWHNKTK
jgi:hypothetical protein